ncbi:hypothetical protein MTY_0403 [Moorella thermoacetica Y72]|uniref:Uncharacterized protein n=1 Tax=Moorella thermoacetica Y72 TaxID=1325331 RepID=A0A0S6U7V7_NEOTH|nr:hypothetical protein MTY_0403 [Moorella thermoacetica Y72]
MLGAAFSAAVISLLYKKAATLHMVGMGEHVHRLHRAGLKASFP